MTTYRAGSGSTHPLPTVRASEAFFDEPLDGAALELDAPQRVLGSPLAPPGPSPRVVMSPAASSTRSIDRGLEIVADVPMGIWKRLAVYPPLFLFLCMAFLPCMVRRGHMTSELLGLGAIGVAGACIRLYARGLD